MDENWKTRLLAAITDSGKSLRDISLSSGRGHGYVSAMLNEGKVPSIRNLRRVCDQIPCDLEWVLTGRDDSAAAPLDPDGHALVPVYNVSASAGNGFSVTEPEEIIDRLAFPPGYLRSITSANPANLAVISVKGRSMEPTLRDDDVVMIDITKRDLSFEGIFVIRDGGDSMLVKRISRASRRGFVMLVSDNPAHPPVERALDDLTVIGKVVWAGVKM
jgi:phage repressor protein C with HTH and peptisase S24 domain